jgi:hypothetical protein
VAADSELKAEGTEFDTRTARPVAPKEPLSSAKQPGHWTSSLALWSFTLVAELRTRCDAHHKKALSKPTKDAPKV